MNEIATAAVSTAFCLCACLGALEGCLGRCVRVAIWWQAAKAQQQFCAPPPTRVPSRRKGSQHGPGALIVGKETSTIFNTRRRAAECKVCSGRRHGQQSFARKGPRAETNVVSIEYFFFLQSCLTISFFFHLLCEFTRYSTIIVSYIHTRASCMPVCGGR